MDVLVQVCSFILLFLIGIKLLQTSLFFFIGTKMQHWLELATSNLARAIVVGTIATILLQSSSLTLILTISLVSVSALSFRQTIGIILGANVGTTISGELLAIAPKDFFLIFLVTGIIFLVAKNNYIFFTGSLLVGISLILIGLTGFESLATVLISLDHFSPLLNKINEQTLFAVMTGTSISALIQSSSASFGIILSLLNQKAISMTAGIAIMLGTNIGTCITGLLAMIGTKKEARLVAYGQTVFNLLTVAIVLPFINVLTLIAERLAPDPMFQLAHISVFFNIFSVIIVLPLIPLIDRYLIKKW